LIEKEVSIPTEDAILSATLCSPHENGIFPIALWLQGSGPIDRNDNMPGQELNNSKAVAHHLANFGIASLRFDKRGVGKSTGDFLSAGHTDLVKDGLNCLRFLATCEFCDPDQIFVIGHSEGALIAPQLSQQFPKLAGIVLLCPFLEKPETLLLRQARELKEMTRQLSGFKSILPKIFVACFDPIKGQRKAIYKIKNSKENIGRLGFTKQPFYWFRQFLELNPEEIFRNTHCPILAISGSKDFQCIPTDVHAIESVVSDKCDSVIVENMSHLLRNEPNRASVFNYAKQINQAIEPKILTLTHKWIEQTILETNHRDND